MAQLPERKYRAWDEKLKRMRTVLSVDHKKGIVDLKDKPTGKVPIADVELLAHLGIADVNRKGIYQGDVVAFPKGDSLEIAEVVRTKDEEWFLRVTTTDEIVPFPWNSRGEVEVKGNKYERTDLLSEEYARNFMIWQMEEVLSSDRICEKGYCRHDLERAISKLSDLTREELIEVAKSLADNLRFYKKSYFEECLRNKR
jgi:YopX protein